MLAKQPRIPKLRAQWGKHPDLNAVKMHRKNAQMRAVILTPLWTSTQFVTNALRKLRHYNTLTLVADLLWSNSVQDYSHHLEKGKLRSHLMFG